MQAQEPQYEPSHAANLKKIYDSAKEIIKKKERGKSKGLKITYN